MHISNYLYWILVLSLFYLRLVYTCPVFPNLNQHKACNRISYRNGLLNMLNLMIKNREWIIYIGKGDKYCAPLHSILQKSNVQILYLFFYLQFFISFFFCGFLAQMWNAENYRNFMVSAIKIQTFWQEGNMQFQP